MYEGRFMSIMPAEAATADELGLLMAGIDRVQARLPSAPSRFAN
jgi:hypothetical protein